MLSVADIPMAGICFTGVIGAILFYGKEYRLATYLGAKVVQIQNGKIRIVQGNMELEVRLLERIKCSPETLIFYEAPHHLKETLKQLCEALGEERPAAAARELTKHYEEFNRRSLGELLDYYQANEPRGEFVLIISGYDAEKAASTQQAEEVTDPVQMVEAFEQQGLSRKEAMRETAKKLGISRRDVYNILLKA